MIQWLSRFVAVYVVAFVFVFFLTPNLVHRRAFDRAFFLYSHDPTPANKAALDHEANVNQQVKAIGDGIGTLILVSAGFLVHWSLKRIANREREENGVVPN